MKRAIIAAVATIAGLIFLFTYKPQSPPKEQPAALGEPPSSDSAAPDGGGSSGKPEPSPSKSTKPKDDKNGKDDEPGDVPDGPADGTYTGRTVQVAEGHGPLQVTVTVVDGKIADVSARQDATSARSRELSERAIPELCAEALSSQGGQVDTFSGATLTSAAFRDSLADAMAQL